MEEYIKLKSSTTATEIPDMEDFKMLPPTERFSNKYSRVTNRISPKMYPKKLFRGSVCYRTQSPLSWKKEKKKFIYKLIRNGARAKGYEVTMSWLIHKVHNLSHSGIPLKAYEEGECERVPGGLNCTSSLS